MEFHHLPVLLNECLDGLNIRPDGADIPDARFQLPISEGGRYEISVTGDGARGSVRFARVRSEAAAPDSQFTDRTKED